MIQKTLLLAGIALCTASAAAAAPDYPFIDKSSPALMDEATAHAALNAVMSERMAKLYPPRIWGFTTQVLGGFTAAGTCVVTARVMLVPRNNPRPTRSLLFKPEHMAMAFDALANASVDSCRALAKEKLDEALHGVASSMLHD